jgi:hypothetical protein
MSVVRKLWQWISQPREQATAYEVEQQAAWF